MSEYMDKTDDEILNAYRIMLVEDGENSSGIMYSIPLTRLKRILREKKCEN